MSPPFLAVFFKFDRIIKICKTSGFEIRPATFNINTTVWCVGAGGSQDFGFCGPKSSILDNRECFNGRVKPFVVF